MTPEQWVDLTGSTQQSFDLWKKDLENIRKRSTEKNYPARMITIGELPQGKLRFAEGGLVGDEQMKFTFMNDGGMMDDGMEVEPTTGNEIPPGSTAEEVADTVDAKLSVGEYVLPADVVQYYGLQKIEAMVKKAKEGLGELEANDRIKGPGDEEDLPFGEDELEYDEDDSEEMAFATGGFLGGVNSGVQMMEYAGPSGDTIQIMFVNGMPVQQIPAGYAPVVEGQGKPTFKSTRANSPQGLIPTGESSKDRGPRAGMNPERTDPTKWDTEDFEQYIDQGFVTNLIGGAMTLANPLMGSMVRKGYQATGQKALEEIDRRLADAELDAASRERLTTIRSQYEKMNDERGGVLGGLFPEGGVMGALMDGKNPFEGLTNLFSAPKTNSQTTNAPSPTQSAATGSSPRRTSTSGVDSGFTPATKPAPKPQQTGNKVTTLPSGTRVATSGNKNTKLQSKTQQANPGGFDKDKESWGVGPMAEGGFVTRRKK